MKRKGLGYTIAVIGMLLQVLVVVQTVYALWLTHYQLSPAGAFPGNAHIAEAIADINQPYWEVLFMAVFCLLLSVFSFRKARYWLVITIAAVLLIAQYLVTDVLRN